MIRTLLSVLLILLFVCPLPAVTVRAEPSLHYKGITQLTGQAGGPAQGIAVQGTYAFVGVGPRLAVVDVADPANPFPLGFTAPFPDFVQGVVLQGTYAYVAAGQSGLRVVDISSPSYPVEVGSWDSPGYAEGLAVTGSTVYLADGPYGLWSVDVSNPSAPSRIAAAFVMNDVYDVAIEGRYAYLAAGGAGLLVADISNPAYPLELGGYDTPGNARAVVVRSGRAYIADELGGLQIINVSDPLHPALLGSLKTYGWVFDVAVSGSTAYLAAAFGGVRIVNVNDPANPLELGSLAWQQSNITGLALSGGRLHLADRKHGLRLVSIADPTHPTQASLFDLFQYARMVVASGNYAYVAAGFNGVRIFNTSDPAHPVEVSSYQFNGLVYFVHLVGSRLYLGTMTNSPEAGLYVLDVSDPVHPQKISYYDWVQECRGIEVVGNLVYIADTGSNVGLKIVDFSNLASPKLLGNTTNQYTGSIAIRGSLAYVGTEWNGLNIYNISNPANITLAGNLHPAGSRMMSSIKFNGNTAYISEGGGFRILDVTNPIAPAEISFTILNMEVESLWYDSGRVYLAEGVNGFEIFDVSSPALPQQLGSYDTLGSVQTLMTASGSLLLADMEGGLLVYPPGSLVASRSGVNDSQKKMPSRPQATPLPLRSSPRLPPPLTLPQPPASPAPNRAASTCVVSSAADSGSNTLRACLKSQVSGDTITFSVSIFKPASPNTIHLLTPLPYITQNAITIDASNAGVILDGTGIPGTWACGICVTSNGNTLRGLQIRNFSGSGIAVGGSNNTIGGSRLVGSAPSGQGNVLSGNQFAGISIQTMTGIPYHDNLVTGNIIGLDATGTQVVNSPGIGIGIWDSPNNIIGSLEPGKNNIVSGNGNDGIQLYGYTNDGNQVIGNYVGTDITGTQPMGNGMVGVYIECGSYNTLVKGNLISANGVSGLLVSDPESDFNVVIGNRIGVTLDGTQPLPNNDRAVGVHWTAYTRIGGTEPGEGNLIYGAKGIGVHGTLSSPVTVLGNQVGLNLPGVAQVDDGYGISLSGAQRSIVGGMTQAEANTVFQDQNYGILAFTDNHKILGNKVGITADGSAPLRRGTIGIWVEGNHTFIQANQVAFSGERGIWQSGQSGTLRRNSIHDNPLLGILLADGGNGGLPAPFLSLDSNGGSGTTCAACMVELFADEGSQGRYYLDSVVADGSGDFSIHKYCPVLASHLTATATDGLGNTSEFSQYAQIPWDCSSPNPAPTLSSMHPTSVTELGPTTLLSITGSGFVPGSLVQRNGIGMITRYVDGSHLEAILPLGLLRVTGIMNITVFNPAPGGGISNALPFTILALPRMYLPIVKR